MKKIIIVGAGGSGYDAVSIIHAINSIKQTWEIIGFLDDNPELIGTKIMGYPVLGKIGPEWINDEHYYVSTIASPQNRIIRKAIFDRILSHSKKMATLIHPTVVMYENVSVGKGTIINANTVLGTNVKIGDNVHVGYGCQIAHESELKNHVTLSSGISFASRMIVGESCYIGCGVSSAHEVTIAENTLVGVGSGLIRSIQKPGETWLGVPARPLLDIARENSWRNKEMKKSKS